MSCCVPNCLSNKRCDRDFSYHAFPSNPILRKNWEKAIFGDDFAMNLRYALVCSKHFISSDFRMNKMRKILRRNAVPTAHIPIRKRLGLVKKKLKFLDQNVEIKPDSGEFETNDLTHYKNHYYSNAISYGLKITHLKNTLKAKTKQVKRLEESVVTLSKKLEYFEKNVVLQNMKRIIKFHEDGQGDTRTSFLLNQVTNFDKAKPHWPKSILHESAILHAECPSGYKALVERDILQLPSEMTLQRYLKHIISRANMPDETQQKPEEETCVTNIERVFCSTASEQKINYKQFNNNIIKMTFPEYSNKDTGNVDSWYTEERILHKEISNKPNLNAEVRNYQETQSSNKLCDSNTNIEIRTSEGSILLDDIIRMSADEIWGPKTSIKMQDQDDLFFSMKDLSEPNTNMASENQIANIEEESDSYVIFEPNRNMASENLIANIEEESDSYVTLL